MKLAVLLLTILCTGLIIYIILLLIQIYDICRQIEFIERHDSSKLITTDLRCKPFLKLAECINRLIGDKKQIKIAYDKSNRTFKDTISGISHDIRTPLTSLNGHFQLLKGSSDTQLNEKYIRIIDGRINALQDMTEQLFTFVKLENPSYTLDCEPVNLTQALCDTLFSFYEQINEAGIKPDVSIPDEIISVNANQAAVKRVIQNIIRNALIHGKSYLNIELSTSSEYAQLIIKNNIADDEQVDTNRVFERFYKADKARKEGSTGLGLFISKQLVERMGGNISAQLEKGLFTIIINLKRSAA